MLEDGTYDGVVVDVEGEVVSITIVSGPHKGEVVDVRSPSIGDDDLDLLATPCTLTVADGQPSVVFER